MLIRQSNTTSNIDKYLFPKLAKEQEAIGNLIKKTKMPEVEGVYIISHKCKPHLHLISDNNNEVIEC